VGVLALTKQYITDIRDISLLDVLEKYCGYSPSEFEPDAEDRWLTLCPLHDDHDPSFKVYDKTAEGKGWDYSCYVCGAGGNATTLLTALGKAENSKKAEEMLRKDFGVEMPKQVTLSALCDWKGIAPNTAAEWGWKNAHDGVEMPYYNREGTQIGIKVRVNYSDKPRFIFRTGEGLVSHSKDLIPYGLQWLDKWIEQGVVYITEGETDALTLAQNGYPVVGIGGTQVWRKEYAKVFGEFRRVILVVDNDAPGMEFATTLAKDIGERLYVKSTFGSVKDVNDLWRLVAVGERAKFQDIFNGLEELPATLECFYSALEDNPDLVRSKKALQLLRSELSDAIAVTMFIERVCKITKFGKRAVGSVVRAALKNVSTSSESTDDAPVYEQGGKYLKTVVGPTGTRSVEVTNYTYDVLHEVRTASGIHRVVELHGANGEISEQIDFSPKDLTNFQDHMQKVVSAGGYTFKGGPADLQDVVNHHLIGQTQTRIWSPSYIGLQDEGVWLFGNCGVDKMGVVTPIKEGTVTMHGKTYTPRDVMVGEGDDGRIARMPNPDHETGVPDGYKRRIMDLLTHAFGTWKVLLCLGWIASGWCSNAIYSRWGFYPMMFVVGKRNSGKSTLAGLMMKAFGASDAEAGMSISTPTVVGMSRMLGWQSSLPQWYDDYRNSDKRVKSKDGLLLDVYNRHGAVKGTVNAGEVKSDTMRGYLLLSGEDVPSNNAVLTRCVTIQVSEFDRDSADAHRIYEELMEQSEYLSAMGLEMCTHYQSADNRKKLIASAEVIGRNLIDKGVDMRYAINHAIMVAGVLDYFGDVITQEEHATILEELAGYSVEERQEIEEDHMVASFFSDMEHMITMKLIRNGVDFSHKGDQLHIRFRNIHHAWAAYRRQHGLEEVINERTLMKYIEKEPYYVDKGRQATFNGSKLKTVLLDLSKMDNDLSAILSSAEGEY